MGTTQVSVRFDDSELEKIDDQAEKADLSRAEYIRQRFRAGQRLWSSGVLDSDLLEALAENSDSKSTTPEKSNQTTTRREDSRPASPQHDLKKIVLQNIPHKESGSGISDDELMNIVFGSEATREEALEEVIADLYGNKITRRHDGKLVKTEG